jgi:hypothetical protein
MPPTTTITRPRTVRLHITIREGGDIMRFTRPSKCSLRHALRLLRIEFPEAKAIEIEIHADPDRRTA